MQSYIQQCLHRPVMYVTHRHGYCGNSARSLEDLCICLHTPLTDTTPQWHHGNYVEKIKIYERLGLAMPRV